MALQYDTYSKVTGKKTHTGSPGYKVNFLLGSELLFVLLVRLEH